MRMDSMLEELENMVDVKQLKQTQDLKTPIEDEAKRQRVDAAKKRAAAQNVDYPCFAALVSCAHLKTMTRKELCSSTGDKNRRQNISIPAWSFDVSGHLQPHLSNKGYYRNMQPDLTKCTATKSDDARSDVFEPYRGSQSSCFENPSIKDDQPISPSQYDSSQVVSSCVVHNTSNRPGKIGDNPNPLVAKTPTPGSRGLLYCSDLFIKEWKQLGALHSSKRLEFLRKFPPSSFPIIFRVEIPPFLLSEILETLRGTAVILRKGPHGNEEEKEYDSANLSVNNKNKISDYDRIDGSRFTYMNQTKTPSVTNDSISKHLYQPEGCSLQQKQGAKLAVSCAETSDCEHWVASVLDALRSCGRFGLAVKLIGQKSRHLAREIINHISSANNDPNMLFEPRKGGRPSELLLSYDCI